MSYGETTIERQDKKQKEDKSKIDILEKGTDFLYIEDTLNKFSESSKSIALQVIEKEAKINDIENPQLKADRLLKYSQLLVIVKTAEKIYHTIYGSQIRLLQKINYASDKSENIKYFYDNAQKYYPDVYENYSYENYLEYLVETGLILFDRTTDLVSITDAGKDFLRYLIESNSNLDKSF